METANSTASSHEFELGEEVERIEIEVRGKKATYELHDISAQEHDSIYIHLSVGNEAEKRAAQVAFRNKIIAAVVRRADGSRISVEDAAAMRNIVSTKLWLAALSFINGGEDLVKKGSTETASGTS